MKKSFKFAGLAAASALLFAAGFTGCSKSAKAAVKTSELPSSGASTYVTSQLGVTSVVSSLVDELNLDYYTRYPEDILEDLVDAFGESLKLDKLQDKAIELIGSDYIIALVDKAQKIVEDGEEAFSDFEDTGKIDFKFTEKPGKAKDLPKGVSLNIPVVSASIKGTADVDSGSKADVSFSVGAKANAAIDEFSADVNQFDLSGKVKFDASTSKITADANVKGAFDAAVKAKGLSAKYAMPSFEYVVKGNVDTDNMTGNGTIKASGSGSGEFVFNSAEFGIEDSPIKYIKATGSANVSIDGNPNVKSLDDISGKVGVNYDVASAVGMVFNTKSGVGGKAVLASTFGLNAKIDLAKMNEFEDQLEKLYEKLIESEKKLSEKEFKALGIPVNFAMSLKFYDDNNKETFTMFDVKSLYDVYSLVYDTCATLGVSMEDLADELEDVVEIISNGITRGMLKGISGTDYGYSSYGWDYDDYDYDDYDWSSYYDYDWDDYDYDWDDYDYDYDSYDWSDYNWDDVDFGGWGW